MAYKEAHKGKDQPSVQQAGLRTEPRAQRELELKEGVEEAIREIRAKLATSSTVIVAIAGGSAAGKTMMVAKRIEKEFGADAVIISTDDYYLGKDVAEKLPRINGLKNFDAPELYDTAKMAEDLKALKLGAAITKPIYDFKTDSTSHAQQAHVKVIIAEGLFALRSPIAEQCDVKLFVEAAPFGQMIRRVIRDMSRKGQSDTVNMRLFVEVALPGQVKNVEPTKQAADIVIKNHYNSSTESQGMGPYEGQVKFMQALDEKLLVQMGAVKLKDTTQVDEYYQPDGMDTKKTGELVRFRHEDGRAIFCYKGPYDKQRDMLQPRLEFEFMQDPGAVKAFLSIHSGGNVVKIEKQRAAYELDGIRINVDRDVRKKVAGGAEVKLGDFVELVYEGKSLQEGKIAEIARKLGLSGEIRVPYLAM